MSRRREDIDEDEHPIQINEYRSQVDEDEEQEGRGNTRTNDAQRPSLLDTISKIRGRMSSQQLLWLLGLAKSEAILLIIGTISLAVSSLVNLVLPNYIGTLVDTVMKTEGRSYLNRLIFIMLGLTVVMAIFTFIRALSFNLAGERVVAKLRKSLFSAIIGLVCERVILN